MNRVLALAVVILSIALLLDPLTVGPTILILAALALFVGAGVKAHRAKLDRQIATMERQTAAQIAHDVNRTNTYHHRRNVR